MKRNGIGERSKGDLLAICGGELSFYLLGNVITHFALIYPYVFVHCSQVS